MTVRATMSVEKPDEIAMTLNLTMSIGEWRRLKDQLGTAFPSWKLMDAIGVMLGAADKVYAAAPMNAFDSGD